MSPTRREADRDARIRQRTKALAKEVAGMALASKRVRAIIAMLEEDGCAIDLGLNVATPGPPP